MNMREFRPMPTTPKAMRHFEKNEDSHLISASILKPSHSRRKRRVLAPYSDTGVNTYPCQPRRGEIVRDCIAVTDTPVRPRWRGITLLRASMVCFLFLVQKLVRVPGKERCL